MNEKRSWPGSPNRYTATFLPSVIRPKSSATVVVVLPPTPDRSSRPTLAVVSVSSVRSGLTSLIAPTRVVLPDPKPPAMRILCAVNGPGRAAGLAGAASGPAVLECAQAIENLLEHVGLRSLAGRSSLYHGDRSLRGQVGEQDAYYAHRQPGVSREIGHGDVAVAQGEDRPVLRGLPHAVVGRHRLPGGDDHGDKVKQLALRRLGPAAGHGVGPHHGT